MLLPRVMSTLNSSKNSVKGAVAAYECVFNRPFWDDTEIRSEILSRKENYNNIDDQLNSNNYTLSDDSMESDSCSATSVATSKNNCDNNWKEKKVTETIEELPKPKITEIASMVLPDFDRSSVGELMASEGSVKGFLSKTHLLEKKVDSSDRSVNINLGHSDTGNLSESNKQVLVGTKHPKSSDNATIANDTLLSLIHI